MASLLASLFVLFVLFYSSAAKRPSIVNPFWLFGSQEQKDNQPWFKKPKELAQEEINNDVNNNDLLGTWRIDKENTGVSAMHMQLMPNNKVVWYDSTGNGLSEIESNPLKCKTRRGGPPDDPEMDCTAHAIEYNAETAEIRTLEMNFNPWCSSGGLSVNGALVSTGGVFPGFKAVRILKPCDNCQFEEKKDQLLAMRWYATQTKLQNGSFVVLGGSSSQNYEIIPPETLEFKPEMFPMPFLDETDEAPGENNLYPFVNLLPDGNLFVFANDMSIILNPNTGEEVHRFPILPGGTRNYPPSAMSALLPIDLTNGDDVEAEVIVCGGNTHGSFLKSDRSNPREFLPALQDCGRLSLTLNGEWDIENMPSPRVMGDMLLLPTGDILMINGAKAGTSAWNAADEPNLTPVLYSPKKPKGQRFTELAPSEIPRMYHSSSAVLPSGEVLVAGSNTNPWYMKEAPRKDLNLEFKFPTDLRVEKFAPPYMAQSLQKYRLEILRIISDVNWTYGGEFKLFVKSTGGLLIDRANIKVTMYSPPFTTHGYSHNQRLIILRTTRVTIGGRISVVAPPSGTIAPPGYYLVFVVHNDVPSRGIWVQIL